MFFFCGLLDYHRLFAGYILKMIIWYYICICISYTVYIYIIYSLYLPQIDNIYIYFQLFARPVICSALSLCARWYSMIFLYTNDPRFMIMDIGFLFGIIDYDIKLYMIILWWYVWVLWWWCKDCRLMYIICCRLM